MTNTKLQLELRLLYRKNHGLEIYINRVGFPTLVQEGPLLKRNKPATVTVLVFTRKHLSDCQQSAVHKLNDECGL